MLLIFMSEHMFRSRDQSVKIQREFSRYTSMALCFFYPHSVPIPHLATRMQPSTQQPQEHWFFIEEFPVYLQKVFVVSTCCCDALNPVNCDQSNLMAVSLPNFAPFDVHADGNAGPRWKTWLARLERMFIGKSITIPKRKRKTKTETKTETKTKYSTLGAIIGDGDRKRAPFLVLGLAP